MNTVIPTVVDSPCRFRIETPNSLHDGIKLRSTSIQTDLGPGNFPITYCFVEVEVFHYWDGESWWHYKPGVVIDGHLHHLVSSSQYSQDVSELAQLIADDSKFNEALKRYGAKHINCESTHTLYELDTINKWMQEAKEIETAFQSIVDQGIIGFYVTSRNSSHDN